MVVGAMTVDHVASWLARDDGDSCFQRVWIGATVSAAADRVNNDDALVCSYKEET
jgi:hypothetical protein